MSPREARGRGSGRQRRKVRIVEPRSTTRMALISFLITAAAAVFLLAVWRFWRIEEAAAPHMRDVNETRLKWRCEAGHHFFELGRAEPRACPRCGKPAYPVGIWTCPEHGEFEVAVRFGPEPDGRARVSAYLIPGQDWTPASAGLHCPKCGAELVRKPDDPYSDMPKQPRKRKSRGSSRGG